MDGPFRYVIKTEEGQRLDAFLSKETGISRSYVQKLIKGGKVNVNSTHEKASYRLKIGDRIELTVPEGLGQKELSLIPEDIPLNIILNDPDFIVINKPADMVVYPSAGHERGTLMNALVARGEKLASIGAPLRPGVVHRLDKDTSGLIVIAKEDSAYVNLFKQFQKREVEKYYLALVYGRLKEKKGEIKKVIGRSFSDRKKMSTVTKKGKDAITMYEVLKEFKDASLLKIKTITGRTHQIRVHLSSIGHPILGDNIYGKKTTLRMGKDEIRFPRQMLHAFSLRFRHPKTDREVKIYAPLPDDMRKALEKLETAL